MSRLKAGIEKLEASKKGLSDAYVQDEFGIWRANPYSAKATGLKPLDEKAQAVLDAEQERKETLNVAKLKKHLKTFAATETWASSPAIEALPKYAPLRKVIELNEAFELAKKLSEKYKEKNELMKDLGIPKKKATMTLNQPAKLTVLHKDGLYRTQPFIGGEEFIGTATKVTDTGKHVVVAVPVLLMENAKHGPVMQIEVPMNRVKDLFYTVYYEEGIEVAEANGDAMSKGAKQDALDAKKRLEEKLKIAMQEKQEADKLAQEEERKKQELLEQRLQQNPEIGSW